MLELRHDDSSGIYSAPLQMKANNGIFVIDDFGRQLISPRELLNRWIVPLDRRVDYLSLQYGLKFEIPFQVLVVFATNLNPSDLADEAFLRRIHNKIYVDPVSADAFDEIFRRVARSRHGHRDSREFRGVPRALPGGRPKRIARLLPQRHLQDSELDRTLREPRSGGDARRTWKRALRLYFTSDREGTGKAGDRIAVSFKRSGSRE